MKTHYTLESLREVKLGFAKEGDPHLNGDSHLHVDLVSGKVRLYGAENVSYESDINTVLKEALTELDIKCELDDGKRETKG